MDSVSFILLVIFILITAAPIVKKYRRRRKLVRIIDSFGGDKCYPIIGTDWSLFRAGRKNFWKEYKRRSERCGATFRSWVGPLPIIHLSKPEHIEAVLGSNENLDKGSQYNFMHPWFGDGLLTSKKSKWRVHRKLLTPTFHFSILEQFSEIFSVKSQCLADQLLPLANGEYFNIFPYLAHCALDIICETAMGVRINSMEHSDSEYVKAVSGMVEKIMERIFNPLYKNDFIYSLTEKGRIHNKCLGILHGFTEKVIRDRQAQLSKMKQYEGQHNDENELGIKRKQTFLDLLLGINETNKDFHLTFEDIRNEVDTFMFGGHDSSTVTTCWTLFLLGNYPEIQAKVHEELDSIFYGEEKPVTSQDLLKMKYLECVIKETLRVFTVVPAVTRNLSAEVEIDGLKIPPGVMAVLHFHVLHKNPELYPDPERFDPDRFLPENARTRHPFGYVPFSAGPRNCIGQKYGLRSSKTLLSTLLRKYKVKALKKPHEVDCYFDVFLRPQDGMHLSLEVRNL